MQVLSFRKVTRSISGAAAMRLCFVALIPLIVLVTLFSSRARTEDRVSISSTASNCSTALVTNESFELPGYNPVKYPLNWTTPWLPSVDLARDVNNAHSGTSSVRISMPYVGDAWFQQEVTVEPETQYMLTGWIKTDSVRSGVGANLSLIGTWIHSEGRFGTTGWTRVSLWFNSGSKTKVTIGARLGYGAFPTSGTAWFDDLRLTPIRPDGSHPSFSC